MVTGYLQVEIADQCKLPLRKLSSLAAPKTCTEPASLFPNVVGRYYSWCPLTQIPGTMTRFRLTALRLAEPSARNSLCQRVRHARRRWKQHNRTPHFFSSIGKKLERVPEIRQWVHDVTPAAANLVRWKSPQV